jgi:hypothetical protein
MKVIFLDIDGVLNSETFAIWCYHNNSFIQEGGSNFINPKVVKLITDLCEEHDVKLVISSSWRLYDLESTIDDFKRYRDLVPLIPYIVGVTPRVLDDRVWQKRGEEIEDYLNKHTEVENYCIIDDDSDMLEEQLSHFLRTNYHEGLTKNHIVLIKNILNL